MSRVYLAVISMLLAQNLAAQGMVVRPEPPLDAGRATLRDALLRFRDSLAQSMPRPPDSSGTIVRRLLLC